MSHNAKLTFLNQTKDRGNLAFKEGNIHEALKHYRTLKSGLKSVQDLTGEWKEQVDALTLSLHLNMAACLLKQGKSPDQLPHKKKAKLKMVVAHCTSVCDDLDCRLLVLQWSRSAFAASEILVHAHAPPCLPHSRADSLEKFINPHEDTHITDFQDPILKMQAKTSHTKQN